MELFINGVKADLELEDDDKDFDIIINKTRDWLAGQGYVIDNLAVNGSQAMNILDEDEHSNYSIEDVQKVEISALTLEESSFETLLNCADYIKTILNFDDNIKDGRAAQALYSDYMNIANGLHWFTEALTQSSAVVGIDMKNSGLSTKLKELSQKRLRLSALNSNIERATSCFSTELVPLLRDLENDMQAVLSAAQLELVKRSADGVNAANADEKLQAAKSLINPLKGLIEKTSSALQTGKDKEAFTALTKLSEGLGTLFSVINSAKLIAETAGAEIEYEGQSLNDAAEESKELLEGILEAFSNEDFVSVSDLLEYELSERLPLFEGFIDELIKRLQNSNADG